MLKHIVNNNLQNDTQAKKVLLSNIQKENFLILLYIKEMFG